MRHEDRRKESGKMLMDISKYMVTICFIGGIITERISFGTASLLLIIAVTVFLVGFYVIPEKKEDE
ncbi:MAG: hypothetical protein NUV74_00020 [Candidatus Brocadiaceae bacterium]|nr:hypothetical protein [Candidatus Brocadiaceae bacterium]